MSKINFSTNKVNYFTLLLLFAPFIFLSAYSSEKGNSIKIANQSAISSLESMDMKMAADTTKIHLALKDFAFKPDTLRIPSGKPVKIIMKNTGAVVHEFMAGKDGFAASGDGFKQDLFHNVTVHHSGGIVEMSDMKMDGMNMSNMKMGEMESSFMIDVKPGKQASISFTLPESKKDAWKMGCFMAFGQTSKTHYDAGMKGVVIVE
jgi:uncharacterized cupredoxin-like copper-binding protein